MSKQTALYDNHVALKAKLVPFAGWAMPIQYATGIIDEHRMVRERAGLFDVSHMGEIDVKGPEARRFLDHLTPSPVSRLAVERAQYSFLCDESGGMIDDIIIYCLAEDHFLICVNAANVETDWQWISKQGSAFKVSLNNQSDGYSLLALQGPLARRLLSEKVVVGQGLEVIKRFACAQVSWRNHTLIVARTGYTGEDGFEVFCSNTAAPLLWNAILEAGKGEGIGPVGLGARDSLRLEAALPLYGHELDRTHSPVESDLMRFVDWEKGAYIGKERLDRDKQTNGKEALVGLCPLEAGIPRAEYPIGVGDEIIGRVTSGGFSPSLEKGIALGFVKPEFAQIGLDIWVEIRKKRVRAVVCRKPFYFSGKGI